MKCNKKFLHHQLSSRVKRGGKKGNIYIPDFKNPRGFKKKKLNRFKSMNEAMS